MKKKNKLTIVIVLIILITLCFFLFCYKKNKQGSDFKIGILAEDGIALVSISKERKMINILKIDSEAQLWIPRGLGWYRNIAVKKILQQEKKNDLLDDILFYNFGFLADNLVYLNKVDDWKSKFWWTLFLKNNNYLTKEEYLNNDIDKSDNYLDEVMIRDYAETKVINEDLKLTIINTTKIDGLANFITKRLERAGLIVVLVDNDESQEITKCKISYGKEVNKTISFGLIKKVLECDQKEDLELADNEMEIYFGDNFSTMINYPSYKK